MQKRDHLKLISVKKKTQLAKQFCFHWVQLSNLKKKELPLGYEFWINNKIGECNTQNNGDPLTTCIGTILIHRETALLFKNGVSAASNLQRIAIVVSHELAHQWFGNLVTPHWWTDLWLNEGMCSGIFTNEIFVTLIVEHNFLIISVCVGGGGRHKLPPFSLFCQNILEFLKALTKL